MRIESIELTWFRGAADAVELEARSKSIVVYGGNGSGKSSFVDAVEYVLNGGRIGHLAHEYSGKLQEKGVINTHVPKGKNAEFLIKFKDKLELRVKIQSNGTSTSSGAETVAMNTWDYRRTILRQDEIADFIRQTKGSKYSALLPLLGLGQMEVTAENIRQLAKTVGSKLTELKTQLVELNKNRSKAFGTATDDEVCMKIESLHKTYCASKPTTPDLVTRCKEIEAEVNLRISRLTADQKKHSTLLTVVDLDLKGHIVAVRTANEKLAGVIEPLVNEKLDMLETADRFLNKLKDETPVKCPACGQSVELETFQVHVKDEKERLQLVIEIFNSRKMAIETLCDTIKSLRSYLGKTDVKVWRDDLIKGILVENFTFLDGFNTKAFGISCSDEDIKKIEINLLPLHDAAVLASKNTPPDVQQLNADKQSAEVGSAVVEAMELDGSEERIKSLVLFLESLEKEIRNEIKLQSKKVMDEISGDIRSMWSILHPSEAIEDIRLIAHADKAIDIGLKFYGVNQDSPRLTLSEGYRNSLGLCIFLSMAKREAEKDRPVLLDDVVVSFDRKHRGMLVELLEKKFSGRQVFILTHDRDWYTELRQQLDGGSWMFKSLMPYERPEIGIRWSAKGARFDDARAQLDGSPSSAGNTARTIMDIELATCAERLKIRLPYLHREKNDHRSAHDFLSQMISDGAKCFEKKSVSGYELYTEAISAFRDADKLLLSWGNKSSHSFDVVKDEADKLISACEKVLELFDCSNCKKPVYKFDDASGELVQCQCSNLRWRYGKT